MTSILGRFDRSGPALDLLPCLALQNLFGEAAFWLPTFIHYHPVSPSRLRRPTLFSRLISRGLCQWARDRGTIRVYRAPRSRFNTHPLLRNPAWAGLDTFSFVLPPPPPRLSSFLAPLLLYLLARATLSLVASYYTRLLHTQRLPAPKLHPPHTH